ncbi:YdaU family protein [Methylobacterium sp. C25]|uniref:DUF1376 domain-containing protein n=1 Tax=Methylobacterium sp. C25 TaxID=2721622 RepID=UPI001F1AC27A|nr:DUF1376 domain-containing protein [Methylobacterium sp. C25]MCE4223424.1 YdaU family protein [Methylobacterium sp. C25]
MPGEFYKMDFEAWDEGTDELTLEQEAAYLRLCHQLYRRKAAIPSAATTLARIWRCHPNKARKLLVDLVEAGKVVERDGHLTNTRVTRELDARETRRTQQADAGHIGGTQAQDNRRKSLKTNDADVAVAPTPVGAKSSRERVRGRDRDQIEAEPLSDPRADSAFPPRAFDEFWAAYPHKVGKDAARRAFDIVRRSDRVSFAEIVDGLARYKASKPPTRDWCHPTTWLNQGRWADQPAEPPLPPARASPNGHASSPQQRAFDRARQAHLELMEDRHDQDPSEADAEGHFGASGPQDRHPHQDVHEPPGGRLRLAPPRLGFPPRAH